MHTEPQARKTVVLFAFGIGNFSGNRLPKGGWTATLKEAFGARGLDPTAVASFGHSGNFVVNGAASMTVVRETAESVLKKECAVVTLSELASLIRALEELRLPRASKRDGKLTRWTKGAVLPISGSAKGFSPWPSDRGRYLALDGRCILAAKSDCVLPDGTLDKDNRKGGWGGLSDDVTSRFGGKWTARSRRTLWGTLQCAIEI
jgi:hypothetical protein